MLRCKISSSVNVLNSFSERFPWIPNEETIRPTKETLDKKKETFQEIFEKYENINNYLLETIFNTKQGEVEKEEKEEKEEKLERKEKEREELIVRFLPNKFPYNIRGNHWILWFNKKEENEFVINQIIENHLQQILQHNNFNFVWYENPKMTIPGEIEITFSCLHYLLFKSFIDQFLLFFLHF